jgi:hypothetical protein
MDDFDFAEKLLVRKSSSTVYVDNNVTVFENKSNAYKIKNRALIGFDENTGKAKF